MFLCVCITGDWAGAVMTNRDVLRLLLTCQALKVKAVNKIWQIGAKAFGPKNLGTNK